MTPSCPEEANLLPSAETATASTQLPCPFNVRNSLPFAGSQIRTRLSRPPVTSSPPRNATARTFSVLALRLRFSSPLPVSHSRSTPSSPPSATRLPSGPTAHIFGQRCSCVLDNV